MREISCPQRQRRTSIDRVAGQLTTYREIAAGASVLASGRSSQACPVKVPAHAPHDAGGTTATGGMGVLVSLMARRCTGKALLSQGRRSAPPRIDIRPDDLRANRRLAGPPVGDP
jgi:hypothetical protein